MCMKNQLLRFDALNAQTCEPTMTAQPDNRKPAAPPATQAALTARYATRAQARRDIAVSIPLILDVRLTERRSASESAAGRSLPGVRRTTGAAVSEAISITGRTSTATPRIRTTPGPQPP